MPEQRDEKDRNTILTAALDFNLEATDEQGKKRLPTFDMVAYTGEPMNQWWSYEPVVIELSGIEVDRDIPALRQHSHRDPIGHVTQTTVQDGKLIASGVISCSSNSANEVVESAKNGFPWQASIGGVPTRVEHVKAGATVEANGRTYTGPLKLIRKIRLHEISFVVAGADDRTSAAIAATAPSPQGDQAMQGAENPGGAPAAPPVEAETPTPAPAPAPAAPASKPEPAAASPTQTVDEIVQASQAEHSRQERIRALTREHCERNLAASEEIGKIASVAIEAKWTPEQFDVQAGRLTFNAPGINVGAGSGGANREEVVQAGMMLATDRSAAEKEFDERTLEAADKEYAGDFSLCELILQCAHRAGRTDLRRLTPYNFETVVEAAMTTTDLPNHLKSNTNRESKRAFMAHEDVWRQISQQRPVRDFREVEYVRVSADTEYKRVTADGKMESFQLEEETFKNKAQTQARRGRFAREDIINDDLDALAQIGQLLGRGAALAINREFWTKFLDDGGSFWSTDNGSLLEGEDTALGVDGLTKVLHAFDDKVDMNGDPLALDPAILLTPTALSTTANLTMSQTQVFEEGNSSRKQFMTQNPHAGKMRPVRSRYLNNSRFPGGSATAWWVLADPAEMPTMQVVFLRGRQTPTITRVVLSSDELGIDLAGYLDFGVARHEARGGIKATGVAA